MSKVLPILFNTDMVRAILDGRKTVTRRVVKNIPDKEWYVGKSAIGTGLFDKSTAQGILYAPYQRGDILYVRETFAQIAKHTFLYKAGINSELKNILWRPSIHMPKEAARIWLQVINVRVEQLRDITKEQIVKEGIDFDMEHIGILGEHYDIPFAALWNSTIKKADLALYGWDANPWVWVIEFKVFWKENGFKTVEKGSVDSEC